MSRFITITLLCMGLSAAALGQGEDWLPQPRHLKAVAAGRDCAIYRSLATKGRLQIDQLKDTELHFTELLKLRRSELISCAEQRGIEMNRSEESEQLAAEVCSADYDQWIRTSFRLQASQQDRVGAENSLRLMSSNLERHCTQPESPAPAALRVR